MRWSEPEENRGLCVFFHSFQNSDIYRSVAETPHGFATPLVPRLVHLTPRDPLGSPRKLSQLWLNVARGSLRESGPSWPGASSSLPVQHFEAGTQGNPVRATSLRGCSFVSFFKMFENDTDTV